MDEKFVMNIVMPDRIPDGLGTVIELLRDYRAMYIEDRRDMIDSVKDALTKNPGKTIQIKGVSVSADDFLGIFMAELAESCIF